ncbi:MAG: Fe-S cluster protein [Planctomycetota bacterium]|nr:MAG: Fe-S cluster protein [Planctomycetota bacterium]
MAISPTLVAALKLGGVGLVFGSLIALAQRYLYVWVDPRIAGARELLPGSDCGACGQPGCEGFAQALVSGDSVPAGCTVMGLEQRAELAGFLGVDAGQAGRRVARLACAGGRDVAVQPARYRGDPSCGAAAAVASGGKGCSWGCLGLGDCEDVCDFDAIAMSAVGLPLVTPGRCTACGDCVEVCPKDLFSIMPMEHKLIVQCRSELEGELAQALCRVACTACAKCALDAAPGLIEMRRGLALVDYGQNHEARPEAIARCPTGAIAWVEEAQFARAEAHPETCQS